MFPEIAAVPPRDRAALEQIWEAKRRYWQRPGETEPPTQDDLRDILFEMARKSGGKGISSKATITRLRKKYGEGRNVREHPTLLFPWPMTREMRPPAWLAYRSVEAQIVAREELAAKALSAAEQLQQLTLFARDGSSVTVEQDRNGVITRIVGFKGAALIAAAFSGVGLLDYMSDGRFDGVIRWCSLFAEARHLVL